jgi:hypothetical protein
MNLNSCWILLPFRFEGIAHRIDPLNRPINIGIGRIHIPCSTLKYRFRMADAYRISLAPAPHQKTRERRAFELFSRDECFGLHGLSCYATMRKT